MKRMIEELPEDYLYGLREIELRPRQGEIGMPFGEYLNDEKKIRIYSAPFPKWILPKGTGSLYEMHGARTLHKEENMEITWPRMVDLAYFIYREVLLHELGHHWHNRYKTKRPHPKTPAAKEASANRHADFLAELPAFQKWYERA